MAPCPKCCSNDIHRLWRERGARWTLYCRNTRKSNQWVTYADWEAHAKKECISHHCRCCQYEWDTSPHLPDKP